MNKKVLWEKYNDSEIIKINLFNDDIQSFISEREMLSYMDWIKFKNCFVYNRHLSDKNSLTSQIISLSRCKKAYTRNDLNICFDSIYQLFDK